MGASERSSPSQGSGRRRRAALFALAGVVLVGGTRGTQDAIANGDTRTLNFYHVHTKETASIIFRRWGSYDQAALSQVNRILRDWRNDAMTRIDPRLLDIVWEVHRSVGSNEPVHINSAYRSPGTNAMLRRRSRGVSKHSQHMHGKALDFFMPDVDMTRVRQIAMRLQNGGVGYYPSSFNAFVHLDSGSVRSWPRMTRDQLVRLFPNEKTVHIPADGTPLAGYEEAKAEIVARGGSVAGYETVAEGEGGGGGRTKTLWAMLFGGDDEDSDYYQATNGGGGKINPGRSGGTPAAMAYAASSGNSDDGGRFASSAANEPRVVVASADAGVSWPFGAGRQAAPAAPAMEEPAEPASPLSAVPLPPRRPTDMAAVEPAPTPPTRPALGTGGLVAPEPVASGAKPIADDRAQLRALFAAVASPAAPAPRVQVASVRPKPGGDAPAGFVADAGPGLKLGFSGKPGELSTSGFTGPAVKPLQLR